MSQFRTNRGPVSAKARIEVGAAGRPEPIPPRLHALAKELQDALIGLREVASAPAATTSNSDQ
jgi:hypothetical protein